eukprot:gene4022-1428_t
MCCTAVTNEFFHQGDTEKAAGEGEHGITGRGVQGQDVSGFLHKRPPLGYL